ncbi:hypothetical protein QBC35DRAFT_452906 [Podospora australis]|uniref:Uncharacterized protein n=1 Tax=Podospora australis TaxID=1536484 RepID=A0AAN7AHG7_9PEZI|nr:hypothetical protein QBC35DRAFT_452906 [Podospora australis]
MPPQRPLQIGGGRKKSGWGNPITGVYNALFVSENAAITRSVGMFGLAVAFLSTGLGEAFLAPA